MPIKDAQRRPKFSIPTKQIEAALTSRHHQNHFTEAILTNYKFTLKPGGWSRARCSLLAAIISASSLALLGCGSSTSTSPSSGGTEPSSSQITIQPMTSVNVSAGTGYFQDPYPIHTIASSTTPGLPTFSGTTQQLLSCSGQLQPACFTSTKVTMDAGTFTAQTQAAGSSINNFEGLNIYQDSSGAWQMAVTAHLTNSSSNGWNVILHASPKSTSSGIPTAWIADALLVGSLGTPDTDDYDGKYFEDSGTLYLTYNKNVGKDQDGVVAQAMVSASVPATSDPVPLLGPETSNGGYNSEYADGLNSSSSVKLIETGNITKIDGKYVMTYSAGTYNRPDYKAGIAWSDTFLPQSGTYYQRVQKVDTAGVWGQPGHAEVQYLLQSQIAQWPNYIASQVLAPGVPAIITDANGNYYLSFAGYDPSDAPINTSGLYEGPHRRPYYIKLQVQIPSGATVSGTSPQDLVNWVQPVTGS
jgi:hypothetical protein